MEGLTEESVVVSLVNLDPVEARRVIVPGGAYAEHRIGRVSAADGQTAAVDGAHFAVELAPGAGTRLELELRRYASPPYLGFPWL